MVGYLHKDTPSVEQPMLGTHSGFTGELITSTPQNFGAIYPTL